MKKHLGHIARIDHLAIAVKDIDESVFLYRDILGFQVLNQREINGQYSGMKSIELCAGGFTVVLVQGTNPESQVSRYVEEYGPGVQHVAVEVEDIEDVTRRLREAGMNFSTEIIRGKDLVQIFTSRDESSGMMFELIKREEAKVGFELGNIQDLFEQLEASGAI